MGSEFVNYVGFIFGVVPLFVAVITLKEVKPVYHRYWFFGVIFLIIAAALFALLESLTTAAVKLSVEKGVVKEIKDTLAIWAYIGPAVLTAIGANLITQFLVLKKPETAFRERVSEVLEKNRSLQAGVDFILSAPVALNMTVATSIIILLVKVFWLNNIPELFAGFYELGIITEAVLASVLASYVFYLIVVHKKEQDNKKVIMPAVNKMAGLIVNDCKKQLAELSKLSGLELDLASVEQRDIKDAMSKLSPKDYSAPLYLHEQGKASWLQYFLYHKRRALSEVASIYTQIVFLEADFVARVTDVEQCHYFGQLEMIAASSDLMTNEDLSFMSSGFYNYCQACLKLNASLESEH